jgi:photosystem II stability/assembly factor-like uncharacterized protein
MKAILLSLSVLISVNLFGQFKKVKDENIIQCSAITSDLCYAISPNKLWKTTDGGVSWDRIAGFSNSVEFSQLSFTSEKIGYVYFAEAGTLNLWKTIDGAVTWEPLQLPEFPYFSNVYMVNDNVGFFMSGGSINKTVDGGKTLTKFEIVRLLSDVSISFFDDKEGFLAQRDAFSSSDANGPYYNQEIMHTVDGGITWDTVYKDVVYTDTLNSFVEGIIIKIHFTDRLNGFAACSKGTILNTTDGGHTWKVLSRLPDTKLYCSDIVFDKNLRTGYVVAFKNDSWNSLWPTYIYKTKDGGKTWTFEFELGSSSEIGMSGIPNYFSKIVDDALYVGTSSGLYKIEDITLGIPKDSKNDALVIYPNPVSSNGSISIEHLDDADFTGTLQASLMDITGRVVQEFQFNAQAKTGTLNNIRPGVYNLVLKPSTGELIAQKIIVVN